jgi:hypothetical protein
MVTEVTEHGTSTAIAADLTAEVVPRLRGPVAD